MLLVRSLLSLLGIGRDDAPAAAKSKRAEWVDEVTNNYAGVAAGVAINRRCRILSPEASADLESDLERFTAALAGQIHPEFMRMAQVTSARLAEDEPYASCGADAREAVLEAQELVGLWLEYFGASRK